MFKTYQWAGSIMHVIDKGMCKHLNTSESLLNIMVPKEATNASKSVCLHVKAQSSSSAVVDVLF